MGGRNQRQEPDYPTDHEDETQVGSDLLSIRMLRMTLKSEGKQSGEPVLMS